MPWDFTRRDFIKGVGAGAAGFAAAEGTVKEFSSFFPREGPWTPGVEQFVPSVCAQCPGACGIIVRIVDGKAVKIEGNDLHPINRGTLCPKGQAGLQALYDPDRIKTPIRRSGERGAGAWQKITWEEGMRTLAEKLRDIRGQGRPQGLVVISGEAGGGISDLWERFLSAFGSPNLLRISSVRNGGLDTASLLTQGVRRDISYDFRQARYILSFSSSFLEDWPAPVWAIRSYGAMRRGTAGRRGRFIQAGARLSMTAANADEWVPIVQGTEASLALGIAHVMIREGLYDKEFVEEHTFGFDPWTDKGGRPHKGFKDLVLDQYDPDAVSQTTGVQVETIIRLAREFSSSKPSIAVGGRGSTTMGNTLHTQLAVHSLNALVGSIDSAGGTLTQKDVPYKPFPRLPLDPAAKRGLSFPRIDGAGSPSFPLAGDVLQRIPEQILKAEPYPVSALILFRADPLSLFPDREGFIKALGKIPFIVSLSPIMDETTQYADLVLPESSYLERWEDEPSPPGFGYPLVGIRQPVVQPLHDTRAAGDVVLDAARDLGFSEAFPWKGFQDVMKYSAEGLFASGRGAIFEVTFEEAWMKLLEQWGLRPPAPPSFDKFWEEMVEKGGWWDPIYPHGEWTRVLRTGSGRFEFFSQRLRDVIESIAQAEAARRVTPMELELEEVLKAQGLTARGDDVYLPHYEPPPFVGEKGEYPFTLSVYEPMSLAGMRCDNQPFLLEILGPHLYEKWETWVEINPERAGEIGIRDGSLVWVVSPVGRIKVRARLYKGIAPDTLGMPLGMGRRASGRWAKGMGTNPLDIVANVTERLPGFMSPGVTRVRVVKA